jgi:hypothetical protein
MKDSKLHTIAKALHNIFDQKSKRKQKYDADIKRLLAEDNLRKDFNSRQVVKHKYTHNGVDIEGSNVLSSKYDYDERTLVMVLKKNRLKHSITFFACLLFTEAEFVVDEKTFKNAKVGDKGWLCYSVRNDVCVHFHFENHGQS